MVVCREPHVVFTAAAHWVCNSQQPVQVSGSPCVQQVTGQMAQRVAIINAGGTRVAGKHRQLGREAAEAAQVRVGYAAVGGDSRLPQFISQRLQFVWALLARI